MRIESLDGKILSETDSLGRFKIEMPITETSLNISGVGFEWCKVNFSDNCMHLEITMMYAGTYDFISLKKANRLLMKRVRKIPAAHLTAYKNGTFRKSQPCFEQVFPQD
jgi:hypothetical protein